MEIPTDIDGRFEFKQHGLEHKTRLGSLQKSIDLAFIQGELPAQVLFVEKAVNNVIYDNITEFVHMECCFRIKNVW
jgi:hypothetical protein